MPSLFAAAAAFAIGAKLALAAPGAFLAAEPPAAPAPAPVAAAAAAAFDCATDVADWSEAKQGWCCEHAGKGCAKEKVKSHPIALNAVDTGGAVDTKPASKAPSSKWITSTSEDPEDDKVRNPEDDKAEEALLDAILAANVTLTSLTRIGGGGAATASSTTCSGVGASVVNGLSPGCLERCEGTGICHAIQQAVDAYLPGRDVNAVGNILCQQYASTRCLVDPAQHQVCHNALNSIRGFGFPTSVEELEARCGTQARAP